MNRRELIKTTALAAPALALPQALLASDPTPLALDDPIAIALNYVEDATTVDTARFPKKAGSAGAAQNCASCALYQAVNGDAGTCTAIPGKLVKGAGWCSAWVARG